MSTANSCDCPTPPGGRVECLTGQAAVCYVDAQGQVVGKCIPISQNLAASLQGADEFEMRRIVSGELSRELGIPDYDFPKAQWVSQSTIDGLVISIQLVDGSSLNIKLPGLGATLDVKQRRRRPNRETSDVVPVFRGSLELA